LNEYTLISLAMRIHSSMVILLESQRFEYSSTL